MNFQLKSLFRASLSAFLLILSTGCTTGTAHRQKQPDQPRPALGITVGDFTIYQSAEEVKKTIAKMGYAPKSRHGAPALIDHLLDPAIRHQYIGRTVPLEKYDEANGAMCEVDLKFNEYYYLENIIVRHVITSENDSGLLDSYLKRYPMLIFQGSDTGENYNYAENKREKITNTDYHFDSGKYAFIHLNHLRTHKENDQYEDAITFNAHDSDYVVQEAYKRSYTAQPHDDSHDDH